jgi:hypothetical protein
MSITVVASGSMGVVVEAAEVTRNRQNAAVKRERKRLVLVRVSERSSWMRSTMWQK